MPSVINVAELMALGCWLAGTAVAPVAFVVAFVAAAPPTIAAVERVADLTDAAVPFEAAG